MPRALIAGGIVLHCEQIWKRQPNLGGEQLGQRLCGMCVLLVPDEVLFQRRLKFRIRTDFDFSVIHVHGAEILRQTFIKPTLSRWIVEVQQADCEIVCDGAPGFVFKSIEHDEVLIVSREKESRSLNGLTLMQRRELVVRPVILESKYGKRA